MASATYYIKWAFAPKLGGNAAVWEPLSCWESLPERSSHPKPFKNVDPAHGTIFCSFANAGILVMIYILSLWGSIMSWFLRTEVHVHVVAGMSYIPGTLIGMETMDYSLIKPVMAWKL